MCCVAGKADYRVTLVHSCCWDSLVVCHHTVYCRRHVERLRSSKVQVREVVIQDVEINCHQSTGHSRLELAYRRISNFAIPQNVIQSNNATWPQQLQAQLKVLSICTLVSICIRTQLYSASRQAYTRTISYVNRTLVHTFRQSYTVKVLQFNTLTVQQLSKLNIRS